MVNFHHPEPPKVYWLDVRAGQSDTDRHEIFASYESALFAGIDEILKLIIN